MGTDRSSEPHAAPILRPGDTCWRIEHADRVAFVVDAADYFAVAKQAIARARRVVYLIGWDFDLRIRLRPDEEHTDLPDELRHFLSRVAGDNDELEIFILQWDGAMLFNVARQILPFLALNIRRKPQVHFRLDSRHPAGACHHQKIVVIDDALAFCGGIDMTMGRWDTPSHSAGDTRRHSPHGRDYQPWHDMTVAVDGAVARALGELARMRWKRATGKDLPVPEPHDEVWPDELAVTCRDVGVGIARTMPPGRGKDGSNEDGVKEIERLWLAAIAAAKRTIYIENQYLAAGRIADAMAERLAEPDGPEIVVVAPDEAQTWLESEVMDSARDRIVMRLRAADRYDRFAVYTPVNDRGESIYVHAKVLIVDDRLIRVGSSNVSNRSLYFDSECDLAVEARDDPALARTILGIRDGLVAEHLGLERAAFERRLEVAGGSLVGAIEAAREGRRPTLCPLETQELSPSEAALVDSRLLNPERARRPERRITNFLKRLVAPYHAEAMIGIAAAGALALAWKLRTPPPHQRR